MRVGVKRCLNIKISSEKMKLEAVVFFNDRAQLLHTLLCLFQFQHGVLLPLKILSFTSVLYHNRPSFSAPRQKKNVLHSGADFLKLQTKLLNYCVKLAFQYNLYFSRSRCRI